MKSLEEKVEEFKINCQNIKKFLRSSETLRCYPPGCDKANFRKMAKKYELEGDVLYIHTTRRDNTCEYPVIPFTSVHFTSLQFITVKPKTQCFISIVLYVTP